MSCFTTRGTGQEVENGIGWPCFEIRSRDIVERADGLVHPATDPRATLAQQRRLRMSAAVLHVPARPSWKCHSCATAWPCQPAKDDIMATSDRTSRMIYLSLHMADAIVDQPGADLDAIFKRLVGWALGS